MTRGCHLRSAEVPNTIPRGGVDEHQPVDRLVRAARSRPVPRSLCKGKDMRLPRPLQPLNPDKSYGFSRRVLWPCGTFYCYFGKFGIVCTEAGIQVSKLRPWPQSAEWAEWFPRRLIPWRLLNGERDMASKWIKAAIAKRKASKAESLPSDPAVCDGRPALTDFMCDLEGPNGGVREPSAVMFSFGADGVRAGLKDDDAGGWCWRQGKTLSEALDAIEKALQSGEGAFRQARSQGKGKKK